jgi:CheY-like chemotaxis protein
MPAQTDDRDMTHAGSTELAARGQYILLIDDDDTILDVLVALLRGEEGYQVIAAHSGKEALRLVPLEPPALVLMDVVLHGQMAEDVLRELRKLPGWDHFAVVLCTAVSDIHEVARRLGCDAYVAKPFDLDDLLRIVERHGPPR